MGILSSNQRKIWTDLSYVLSNMATNLKDSKLSVVILIYCSFLVDNILLTMVVPIIPDYLERINAKSDKIAFNNLTGELNGTLTQSSKEPSTSTSSSLPSASTATSTTPTTTSTSLSTSSPSSSSSLPLFLPTSTSLLSPSFLSSPSSLNGNIFIQWNQSKESLGSFGEKISYRKLLEGKVVNRRKKDYEKEQDDVEKEIGNEDEDDHDDGNDDRKEKKVEENEDGKSYRLIVKANKSLNTLMEGQTDWTGSKKVMNPHENEPIDWKSIPIRRSRIVELMLKDKFGDAGNPKEKDSHIGYGTYNSHRHYHPHYYHHFHNHQLSNAPKTNIQGAAEDKMDDNQEERLVGTLFASKAVFQLLFNPVSMKLIQSYGHNCTQTIALMVLLCSSLTYAFSQGIKTMFLARCIHGVGSSIISISGMATIANLFQDEKARCQIMGISLGGIAAGVLVGYPFGGFAYDFCGKQLPFLLIAFLFTLIIGFQLTFMPNEKESDLKIETFHFVGMVKDLDIMLAIGSIFFTTSITAVCEPILPIYLIDSLNAPEWQLGIAFLPDAFGYIIGAHILGFDKYSVDKWVITIISLFLAGFATILIPLTTHFYQLIIPQFASGLSIGITDAAMSTQLASIVDERYSANYSMIYTFSQMAVCLAYIIGPIVSSIVLPSIGTTGSFHVLGITVILYGIVCISYRVYLAEIFGRHLSEVIPILSWNSYETIENP